MLTKQQRELLWAYPAAMITSTIVDPDHGISRIKSGQCGGMRRDVEWLEHFETGPTGIQGGTWDEPKRVVVTFSQLKSWARSVPADMREKLRTVQHAQQAEAQRVYKWCHCHHGDAEKAARCEKSNEGDPFWGGRYHPTDAEDEGHLVIYFDLIDQEKELLEQVLGLGDEPVGQLDLFEMEGIS